MNKLNEIAPSGDELIKSYKLFGNKVKNFINNEEKSSEEKNEDDMDAFLEEVNIWIVYIRKIGLFTIWEIWSIACVLVSLKLIE